MRWQLYYAPYEPTATQNPVTCNQATAVQKRQGIFPIRSERPFLISYQKSNCARNVTARSSSVVAVWLGEDEVTVTGEPNLVRW